MTPPAQTTAQIVLTIVDKVVQGVDQGLTQRPTLLSADPKLNTGNSLAQLDFVLPGIFWPCP